jgi:hypothetical protein
MKAKTDSWLLTKCRVVRNNHKDCSTSSKEYDKTLDRAITSHTRIHGRIFVNFAIKQQLTTNLILN